jgi:hypothetical protein
VERVDRDRPHDLDVDSPRRARDSRVRGQGDEAAVATIAGGAHDSPWSLLLDAGGLRSRSPGESPERPGGPVTGLLTAASVRVSSRGRVHVAGELGLTAAAMIEPIVTGPTLAPTARAELALDIGRITPSIGWGVSAHIPLFGASPGSGPGDHESLLVATGPSVGFDAGLRDKPHLRVRLDLADAPARMVEDGLHPSVSLTAGVEIPLGRS